MAGKKWVEPDSGSSETSSSSPGGKAPADHREWPEYASGKLCLHYVPYPREFDASVLPDGAKLVDQWFDLARRSNVFLIHHDGFRPVPDGSPVPEYLPIHKESCWDDERKGYFAVAK